MPRLTNKPRRRPDGRFEVRLSIFEDGKPVRLSVYGKTAQEAERRARELKTQAERGMYTRDSTTVTRFARDWLEHRMREVSLRTLELYAQELAYALPNLRDPQARDGLGSRKLQEVKPAHIRAVLNDLMARYSVRTVKKVRLRLWQLFREALDMELVYRNPVDPVRIKTPRGQANVKVGRALELHEVQALLASLDVHKDPRTALALRLMLACGLRLGEALGLQWQDINPETGTLTVRRGWSHNRLTLPKTATSARTVPIPLATLDRLHQYRDWWADRLGTNPPAGMWLFPGNDQTKPLDYSAPNRALRRIIQRLEQQRLEREDKSLVKEPPFHHLRVHDLRHSYGSHLLANGAPLELVSERMGHANPNITLGVYRHLLQHERQGWVLDPEDLLKPRARA